MRLNARAFAFAAAIIAGSLSLVLNVLSVLTGFATAFFAVIEPFHPGYSHTLLGAFISAFWMVIYGYVIGATFALIYNAFTKG
ncbi:MAG: hypothetical protein K8I29_12690 [Alphaproteobacteria bacterium]|uniref:Uncharacterized protein n=1 Tax=Candidatus Nitrobium versatile TaxID=2884831 RepID=A0A953M0N2_9BACT|nr:hypothetical protein [Candidatus Nitrobium versatile]